MDKTTRILYLDDCDTDRELVRNALEAHSGDFEIIDARDKKTFKRLFKPGCFDLVLSEFNIAGFGGIEVLKEVRNQDPKLPVVIITGIGSEEVAVKAMKHGASDYVIKQPEQFRKLPQTIRSAIEKKALRDQREKAENDLRESERRYRLILENALLGIYQVTLEGKFIYANQKLLDMLGFASFEALAATVDITDCYARPEERHHIIEELLSKGFIIGEVELKRQNGEVLWVKHQTRKTIDTKGDTVFEGLMEDITTIRAMKSRLHQSQKLEAIGTLAGGISHDFNNILTTVIGFTKLALDEAKSGSMMEDNLYEIYIASQRAKDLVKQLLAFAQYSDEENKSVKIRTIVNDTIQFIRATLPSSIGIRQSIESHSSVMCNATQLYQAMINLFTNAAHALPDAGGVIEISLKEDYIGNTSDMINLGLNPGDYVRLTVSDNGTGIHPDIIDSVFEPYFTTKEVGVGTGLGLAQVHGIIESFGGKIFVESTLGTGSHFSIYLPAIKSPGMVSEELESESTASAHILFIDDETQIVKLCTKIIERMGYRVTAKTSSREALELFRKDSASFDLVISDMTMPDITGDILSARMLEIRPDIPIILLTGYNKNITADIAKQIGARALAFKPVVLDKFSETIRAVLDDSRHQNRNIANAPTDEKEDR